MTVTATLYDMSRIAIDAVFVQRVQASVFNYAVYSIGAEGQNIANHVTRKAYAFQVLNNPNVYIADFAWAAASNPILANDVVTQNAANFTTATTDATVAAAVTTATPASTGATDSDINNAVAAAWNTMANCNV
jgi:hypothetical protein